MNISIIGAGNVGIALGQSLVRAGHSVSFGVPNPPKYADAVAKLGNRAKLGSITEAIEASDFVILAIPYNAAQDVVRAVTDWNGKVLVDATNPLAPGLAGLQLGTSTSGAETIAKHALGARVVKAFNTTGAENMLNPQYPTGRVMMPVCGDDADARARVMAIAQAIGFEAIDYGPLMAARYLEPFAMTWIHLAFKQRFGREFAFGLLRRSDAPAQAATN